MGGSREQSRNEDVTNLKYKTRRWGGTREGGGSGDGTDGSGEGEGRGGRT